MYRHARYDEVIKIKDIDIMTSLGLYPREYQHPQPVTLSLALFYTSPAQKKRKCHYRLNYETLVEDLVSFSEQQHFFYVEEYADMICQRLLQRFPTIQCVQLMVWKNKALTNGIPGFSLERHRTP